MLLDLISGLSHLHAVTRAAVARGEQGGKLTP